MVIEMGEEFMSKEDVMFNINTLQQGALPKAVKQTKIDHKYEVQENGDVKSIQTQVIEFLWAQREFLSVYRENEKALEDTRKSMGEEHIKKMQDQEKKIVEEMVILKPIVDESERLGKIAYEKMITEGLANGIKSRVALKEIDEGWFIQVWSRTKQERKVEVMKLLGIDEQSKLARIIGKLKRKRLIK